MIRALGALAAAAVLFCPQAFADGDESSTPTPPPVNPTPGIVGATGGNTSGTSPGSGCSSRLTLRNNPIPQSPAFVWNTNGDAGWPFGWPGQVPISPPTTAPTVGCSR